MTQLTFEYHFNQQIYQGVLPALLMKLQIGYCFNKPLN